MSKVQKVRAALSSVGYKVGAVVPLSLVASAAFAQDADPTADILAKITLYTGYAIIVSLAFTGAVMALRSSKLVRRG